MTCQWASCNAAFPSMSELVGHVNLTHLHPSSEQLTQTTQYTGDMDSPDPDLSTQIACLWGDCRTFPTSTAVEGPSKTSPKDVVLKILSGHLLQDHLGLSTARYLPTVYQHPHQRLHALPAKTEPKSTRGTSAQTHNGRDIPTPPPSSTASPAPQHDCSAAHCCQWDACGETFQSCDDLTAHIAAQHVGSGQRQYHCHWADCQRHGEQGFSSKQKILRHLQVRR